MLDDGQETRWAGLAEPTLGGNLHRFARAQKLTQVLRRTRALPEHTHAFQKLDVADTARRTLPAGFVGERNSRKFSAVANMSRAGPKTMTAPPVARSS